MNLYALGNNIKKWRSFHGKKQAVLAKEINISRTMLSRYENGRSVLTISMLEKIASKLEIDPGDLLREN